MGVNKELSDTAATPVAPGESLTQLKLARLVADPRWIYRRIEALTLQSDGYARRKISFDFQLDNDTLESIDVTRALGTPSLLDGTEEHNLGWYSVANYRGTDQVAIPLCFMQKTTLINLDVVGKDGKSLSVATFHENAMFANNVFAGLIQAISDADPQTSSSSEVRRLAEQAYEVVKSNAQNAAENEAGSKSRFAKFEAREHYAAHAASLIAIDQGRDGQEPVKSAIGWEGNSELSELLAELDEQEDNSPVVELAQWALGASGRIGIATGADIETQSAIKFFLTFLATMVQNYIFVVIADRRAISGRYIFKVSYNAALLTSSSGADRFFKARETIDVSVATMSAQSTHLELETLNTMQFEQIDEVPSNRGQGEMRRPVSVEPNQVHLTSRKNPATSRSQLRVALAPASGGPLQIARIATWINLLLQLVLLGCAVFIAKMSHNPQISQNRAEILGVFRDQNAVTIAALVVTVTVAAVLANHLHDLDRRLMVTSRTAIVASAFLFAFGLICYSGVLTYQDRANEFSAWSWVAGLGICFVLLSVLLLLWMKWISQRVSAKTRPERLAKVGLSDPSIKRKVQRRRSNLEESGIASESSLVGYFGNPERDLLASFIRSVDCADPEFDAEA